MPPADPHSRPNLLFIMDDQHRWDYLGCMGADFVRTPNLDALAAAGTLFRQCVTNVAVCAPARIGLATGVAPHRLGAGNNNVYLPQSRPTYYQRLRDSGYRVGCVGKLDLAKPSGNNSDGARPATFSWGFTHPVEAEGKMHAGQGDGVTPFGPYTRYLESVGQLKVFSDDYTKRRSTVGYDLGNWDSPLAAEHFEDAWVGRRSAQWIDEIEDDYPWHLFVSFVGPHDPYDPPTEYADKYRDAAMPEAIADDLSGKPAWVHKRNRKPTPEQVRECRRQYCAAIELIDDAVGEILAALDRRGMRENTYIVFSSDHGEMLGDHGFFTKAFAYEASIRVPLIVSGPGLPEGGVSDALVELIDLNPTLCEFAGLERQPYVDGKSLAPLLRGEQPGHRDSALSTFHNYVCLRTGRWKLIQSVNDTPELYDLEADPDELRNVIADNPEVARELSHRLAKRLSANTCEW